MTGDSQDNISDTTELEGLSPIPGEERTMGLSHYIPVWWSSLIIVQAFAVAFFAVYPHGNLNLVQAGIAIGIGTVIATIFFILNGFPGYEEGIPFAVQTRSAFGIRGAVIPNYLRIIPAIGWLGIGNWIGALAIQTITTTLWGFGNVWVYFVLFVLLNVGLALNGITSIKWFDSVAAGILGLLLAYTVYLVLTTQQIPSDVINHPGSWGSQFYATISAAVGFIITGALNASDLSRHLKEKGGARNHVLGHAFGIAPPMMFMLLVGLVFGVSTGNANPIEAIMIVAPNPLVGSAMLLFVLGAQISTNLTLNILPPTHVFQDSLGISWRQGVVLTSALSVVSFPWYLFSSNIFYTFINAYSVFLGPALGILIADYWIIRKRDTDITSLYTVDTSSKFWFIRGFSISALLSLLFGAVVSVPFLDISWMVGMPIGFVCYCGLKRFEFDQLLTDTVAGADRSSTKSSND
ncbi:cytosine permease [Haladaptatus pallidirubidus]|uniref:NCS1 family transporter n=1 Tax=Haladaptatus pallidirubidus TaxID=1008152 RepID=A0AAV3UQR5_9EURY|nr:cytosine permease [Haladaptatus pallidirubidus]